MKPDIVMENEQKIIILDTKYKLIENESIRKSKSRKAIYIKCMPMAKSINTIAKKK